MRSERKGERHEKTGRISEKAVGGLHLCRLLRGGAVYGAFEPLGVRGVARSGVEIPLARRDRRGDGVSFESRGGFL